MKVILLSLLSTSVATGELDESGMLQAKKVSKKFGQENSESVEASTAPQFKWTNVCETWFKSHQGSFLWDSLTQGRDSVAFQETATVEACQERCTRETECNVAVFVPGGKEGKFHDRNAGRCVLHSDPLSDVPADVDCTNSKHSGNTYHLSPWAKVCDTWYPRNDMHDKARMLYDSWNDNTKSVNTFDLEACKKLCKGTIDCNMIVHVDGNSGKGAKIDRCVLKAVDTTDGPPQAEHCNNVQTGNTYYTHYNVLKQEEMPEEIADPSGCENWSGSWKAATERLGWKCNYDVDATEIGCKVHVYSPNAWFSKYNGYAPVRLTADPTTNTMSWKRWTATLSDDNNKITFNDGCTWTRV